MQKCKISIFIPSFEKGGVEKNIVLYAKILVSYGYTVDIVYNRVDEKSFFNEIEGAVNKVKLGQDWKIPFIHPRIMDCINIAIGYYVYLKKNKHNLIVMSFQNSVLAIIFCKIFDINIIVRMASHPKAFNIEKSFIVKISFFLKKIFYKHADLVITNSEACKQAMKDSMNIKAETVYNPSFNQDIIMKSFEKLNDDIFMGLNGKKIIAVGRLSEEKDFETLIKAFKLVLNNIESSLIIIGDGAEKKKLLSLMDVLCIPKNKIYFAGFKLNPYNYIKHSDLFVLSSKYEGLPNVLIEAISIGAPSVSTDCPSGPREILMDGLGGDLVKVGDSKELAMAIIKNLSDHDYAKSKHALAFAGLQRFSYANIQKQILNIVKTYE